MDETGDEDFNRCSRNGSGGWRCKEKALAGKTLCEKHHLYNLERTKEKGKKRKLEENSSQTGGGEVKWLFSDDHNGGGGTHVVEEFAGLFGGNEVNGGGVNFGFGGESFNLFGQQQIGGFGQGCGNLGQFQLGDGVGNSVAGLGQPWNSVGVFGNAGGVVSGNRVGGVCENAFLGISSEGLVAGEAGFGSLYDRSFQALLCQGRVCDEDVSLIGGSNSTGFQGLVGESGYGFRSVGNLSQCGKFVGENVGSIVVPESSNKVIAAVGVDEGMEKLLSGGVCIDEKAKDEGLKPLIKMGRPKGSKNKSKKKDVNFGLDGGSVCGSDNNNVGTIGMSGVTILESGKPIFCGKADHEGVDLGEIGRTEKRGHVGDWKHGREIVLGVGYEVAGDDDTSTPRKRRGRKGLIDKQENVDEVCNEVDGVSEVARPKKRGRPKGSVNRKKNVKEVTDEVGDSSEMARPKNIEEVSNEVGGASQVARPKSIEEVSNEVGGASEIARPKRRGRPKGSKCGTENVMEVSNEVVGDGKIARPKKRGRPKGSKCGKEIVLKGSDKVASAGEIERPKKRGRPKGSKKEKWVTYVCASKIEGADEIATQGSENKKLSILCQKGADKFASLTNKLGPALCTRNKLRGTVSEDQECQGMSVDIHLEVDNGTMRALPSGLEITTLVPLLCEQEKGIHSEAADHIENITTQPIVKRGRPKGSVSKKKKLEDQELPVQTLIQDAVQNDCNVKLKRGRPKGVKNKKSIAGEAGSKLLVKAKKRRGRPKGSGKKQKKIALPLPLHSRIERRGRPKGSGKKQKEIAFQLDSQIESQKSTCFDVVLSTIMPQQKHVHEESDSTLEDQVNKKEKSDVVLGCSKESGIEKITKGLMSESSNVHKRCSERLRKLLIDDKSSPYVEVEETTDHEHESSQDVEVEATIDHDHQSSQDVEVDETIDHDHNSSQDVEVDKTIDHDHKSSQDVEVEETIDHDPKNSQDVEVEETIDHGLESPHLMVSCPLK